MQDTKIIRKRCTLDKLIKKINKYIEKMINVC